MSKSFSRALVIILFLAWITPGLVGRDLWKADEPYSFGLVYHVVQTGDWVVPTLAGEPFLEKPPIYYLTAAAFARALSPPLTLHEAARLASGFYMMATLIFLGLAARELYGPGAGGMAAVMLLGATGLQVTAHKLITDVALLTGFAAAYYGLALCRRRPALGGFWIGTGTGIGFLSKGLLAPGVIAVTAVLLPVLFGVWRRRAYLFSLLFASAGALPWLLIWPAALLARSPQAFREWFWDQNLGRFFGFGRIGPENALYSCFTTLLWFALPALPLAAGALWRKRRVWRELPEFQLPLLSFLVLFSVLSLSSSGRDLYALPLLLPLTLLATAGVRDLGYGPGGRIFGRTSIVFFALAAGALWVGWSAGATGHPAVLARKLHDLQPAGAVSLGGFSVVAASLYTLSWAVATVRFARRGYHPVIHWTAGIVLIWALSMTLWLPWLDAGSGYRTLFTSLREAVPSGNGTIASLGLGESERAMLEYYGGILTRRIEVAPLDNAELLLVESCGAAGDAPSGTAWRNIWKETRPAQSDHPKETFRLFRRIDASWAYQTAGGDRGGKKPSLPRPDDPAVLIPSGACPS